MALPSQSGRPATTAGRIYSSRRKRRRSQGGLPVLLGGAAALALAIYGLLWVFGVFGSSGEPKGTGEPVAHSGPDGRDTELRQLGDPLGLSRSSARPATPKNEPPKSDPGGSLAATAGASEPDESGEGRSRRNVLREGIEQSVGGSEPGVVRAPTGDEVLASDGGATPIEKSAPVTALGGAGGRTAEVDRLLSQGDKPGARRVLNEMLRDTSARETERAVVRTRLAELNADLVFGSRVAAGDPMCELYEVQGGDRLSKIADRRELAVHWKLIQRVNGLSDPNRIREGQKLKLVRGPFHAIVDKSEFRMDVYHGQPNAPESWTYIRSFSVGLGKEDGTPVGTFVVARSSKVENPGWVNPRNSAERYAPNDPQNPIGEFWIGLEGQGAASSFAGYGIHGTIEPDSIGEQRSLGCVRLLPGDIALAYELLEEGISVVQVVP